MVMRSLPGKGICRHRDAVLAEAGLRRAPPRCRGGGKATSGTPGGDVGGLLGGLWEGWRRMLEQSRRRGREGGAGRSKRGDGYGPESEEGEREIGAGNPSRESVRGVGQGREK